MKAFRNQWRSLLFTMVLLTATPTMASDPPRSGTDAGNAPIKINADRLEVFHAENRAEFSGRVKATQANTVLTADQLSVFYKATSDNGAPDDAPKAPMSTIERIISTGTVVIRFDNKVAEGDKAIYNTAAGILELTGAPCRVTSDGNVVTGSKITVFRTEDRVHVAGDTADRVTATIFTQDGQLAPEKPGGSDR